jgi:hypothetical protein
VGRGEEAVAEAKQEPLEHYRLWAQSIIYFARWRRAESDEALRELVEMGANESAYQIAEVHAMRSEADQAFEWPERAHALRDPGLTEMLPTPHLRSLHGDPRWAAFLKKMGFGE